MLPYRGIGAVPVGNIKHERIHTVFEAIALQYPDEIAVAHHEQAITYRALNERASDVAGCLINKGIKKGDIVAVKLDKGIELIVALLAVMKAGAAYLPLDPSYPLARINYMLEDSNTGHVLTSAASQGGHYKVQEIDIAALQGPSTDPMQVPAGPGDLAYLIYTSGTTGQPKGVMVEHAGFVNMCLHQIFVYQLGPQERVLQFASISFDASVYEIFIALLSGATLVLVDKDIALDRKLFLDYIDRQGLSFILLPPVFLNSLERPEFKTVKTIVTAGEACHMADALHYSRTKRYFNAYGPTEASVCVSLHQVMPDHAYENFIPIGKAIPGISFHVLDDDLAPVPEGEPGELYIGGIGLAKGYINKPELTQQAFLEPPNKAGERIYRTGDIVKMNPDGNLIILGRKDNQVKILGNRIELGAIEHAMLQTAAISNAHVCVFEQEGDKYLCAYFTSPEQIPAEQLRERLLEELPSFMVPHCFMQVPAFRMTHNGKIDKEALPSPFGFQDPLSGNANDKPAGTAERLLDICKEVLGIGQLDISDNFFLMGGHSLKAARLAAKINKAFHVDLSVSNIYKKPHISEIHDFIRTAQTSCYQPILPAAAKRYYATSAAQKRMYLMHCTDKQDLSYNVSIVLRFDYKIARSAVNSALKVLSDRHEVLRTRFGMQSDELVQEVLPEVSLRLLDGGTVDAAELSAVAGKFVRPFELSMAPVMRVGYYEIARGGSAVIFDTHHIIADGTSMGILVNEFVQLLDQENLPELSLQYKDFAEWENSRYAEGYYFTAHEQYWLNIYKDIPKLNMPADCEKTVVRNSSGDRLSFRIDSDLTGKLKRYAAEADVSLYQLLLSIYYLLLSQYTQQQDIVVGTAVANRKKEEVQQMMGMFVNTLALRARVPAEISFNQFVSNIKHMVLEAFEYQEYPFELLISRLGLSGNASKVPLIDTLFVVQNIDFFSDQAIPGLSLKYENATATAKFDFSFLIVEQPDSFVLELEYNTGMYGREYMSGLAENFIKLAGKAVAAPSAQLEEISLMDQKVLSELRNLLNTDSTIADVEFDL
jgi:fengycin family lipopeptide synthetase D